MNFKRAAAEALAAKAKMDIDIQANYADWIQRIQPRLDDLAIQTGLLQQQVGALTTLVNSLEQQTLQTIRDIVKRVQ